MNERQPPAQKVDDKWKEVTVGDTVEWTAQGQTVIGTLVLVEYDKGENFSTVYTIKQSDRTVYLWGSTVLDRKMKKIENGQEVKIEYLGLKENQKGSRTYKAFRVYTR